MKNNIDKKQWVTLILVVAIVGLIAGLLGSFVGNTTGNIIRDTTFGGSYQTTLNSDSDGPRIEFGTRAISDRFMSIGAWGNVNNLRSRDRLLRIYDTSGNANVKIEGNLEVTGRLSYCEEREYLVLNFPTGTKMPEINVCGKSYSIKVVDLDGIKSGKFVVNSESVGLLSVGDSYILEDGNIFYFHSVSNMRGSVRVSIGTKNVETNEYLVARVDINEYYPDCPYNSSSCPTSSREYDTYYATSFCDVGEVAINGMGTCSGRNVQMVSFTGTGSFDGGYPLSGWVIGCKGYGTAEVKAICVKVN